MQEEKFASNSKNVNECCVLYRTRNTNLMQNVASIITYILLSFVRLGLIFFTMAEKRIKFDIEFD